MGMKDRRTTYGMLAGVLALVGASAALSGQSREIAPITNGIRPKVACDMMVGKTIPAASIGLKTSGATITAARLDPGTGPIAIKYNFVPEHCYITGAIKPIDPQAYDINFAVAIPTLWNQKAWQFGGNQQDGFIPLLTIIARGLQGSPMGAAYPPRTPYPVAEGYATFGGDAGHKTNAFPWNAGGDLSGTRPPNAPANTPPIPDGNKWFSNEEAYRNFGHEQIKKTYDAAVWVMQEMYGTRPSAVFFGGQSAGAREALMAASHYPDDYAGISATAGVVDVTSRTIYRLNLAKLQATTQASIPAAKVRAIRDETLRQCDDLDGLADGVIDNYADCAIRLDHTITPNPFARIRCANGQDTGSNCLSDKQLAIVNAVRGTFEFGFPLANGYTSVPGWQPGQEIITAQAFESISNFPDAEAPPKNVNPADLGSRYPELKADVVNNPFSAYKDQFMTMSQWTDVPTDWSKFLKSKTKLVWHVIASDPTVHGRATMRVYEEMVKRHGQAAIDQSIRFYVTPQGDHGARGFSATTGTPQPRYFDLMGAMLGWVDKGTVPADSLVATYEEPLPPYTVMRSRPLCRYPRYPRYKGSGSQNDAQNYVCTMPQSGSAVAPRTAARPTN